jgi:superfamily II DNA or RNA helicase
MSIVDIYNKEIYTLYKDLKSQNYQNDYHKIYKIFEYYSCILLTNANNVDFYEYNDIPTDFKINNYLSILDTGIDCCDLNNTIVQCKLRSNNLTWTDCSSFIASKTSFNKDTNQEYIRWLKCVITRNNDCKLSKNLTDHNFRFIDKPYDMNNFYEYCENLLLNPPITKQMKINSKDFKLRDYQIEAIDLIKNQNNQNIIINLPTGSGKNVIIIHSIEFTKKYLILVSRIVLLYQLKEEFKKFGFLTCQIQYIGDNNKKFDIDKLITICVYNSIDLIKDVNIFDKIYIDEAHHIYYPDIYKEFDDEYISDTESTDYDSESESNETESKASLEFNLSYIDKIKSMHKLNKIVYLSATIDPLENDIYYQKSINYMIDNKYLSDYQIIVPIFNQDPTNTNIANYLINNYSNIIIYCKTQAEGLEFNNLLNSIVNNSSEYIDCNTSKINRNNILNKFKEGNLRFLVNVRILTEGFDCPITKGIMFLHLPSTRNTIIQCIGRSLRLDKNKLNAKIILPYSTSEDNDNITNFINILSQYDDKIKKGRLSIRNENKCNVGKTNLNDFKDIELITEQIYENINFDRNSNWYKMLEKLEQYIKINNKLPSQNSENKYLKYLSKWYQHQMTNYNKKTYIFKNINIIEYFESFMNKYKHLFKDNIEKWKDNLLKLEQYILKFDRLPQRNINDKTTKRLSRWTACQKENYKSNTQIMQDIEIRKIWNEFINRYPSIFKDKINENYSNWYLKLVELEKYIIKNNSIPMISSEIDTIKQLGNWKYSQTQNYKKEIKIMKDPEIRNIWNNFTNKYKHLFMNNIDIWYDNISTLSNYIDKYNKLPSAASNDNNIKKLGRFITTQKKYYKDKKYIMKQKEILKYWEEFINKYKKFF